MTFYLRRLLFLVPPMICLLACTKKPTDISPENTLAKIGNRIISIGEFIRRSEYTPRPQYCRGDNYIHKKIVLNSLIAEKLLAIEAGEDKELAQNASFQAYIKGRKEQAMRQWLYYEGAYKQVKLDSSEIMRMFELAGRSYDILHYSMPDSTIANYVQNKLNKQGYSFEDIYREHFGEDSIPRRTVSWSIQENPAILTSLFSSNPSVEEVLGPLETGDGSFLVMKVLGWRNRVAISDTDIEQRWRGVVDVLRREQAEKRYKNFASKVMRGKAIEFFEQTFYAYADRAEDFYLKPQEEKEKVIGEAIWDWERETPLRTPAPFDPEFKNAPFFSLDGQIWSVGDVERLMKSHPLVFRKRRMSRNEFPEQFKLAVVDMMRDFYLTQEAHKRGYDKVPAVKLNTEMWRDHYRALNHRNRFLKTSGFDRDFGENYMQAIEEYLNPYVDRLQDKYSSIIEINVDQFEKIELTHIDMLVTQRHVPYPVMIPSFPILTTDNRLDYGRKMSP